MTDGLDHDLVTIDKNKIDIDVIQASQVFLSAFLACQISTFTACPDIIDLCWNKDGIKMIK